MRERVKRPFQYVRNHSPASAPPSTPSPSSTKVKMKRRKALFLSSLVVIGLGILITAVLLLATRAKPYESKLSSLQEQTSFPLLKPSIPQGYSLAPEDIKIVDGIVFLKLKSASGSEAIEISQQPTPPTKIDELFSKEESPSSVDTKNGKLVVVESPNIKTGILVTPESWVNITVPLGQPNNLLEEIANNLAGLD